MLDPRIVLPIVDEAHFQAAREDARLAAVLGKVSHEQGGGDEERRQDNPAAVGELPQDFFPEQSANDEPAHEVSRERSMPEGFVVEARRVSEGAPRGRVGLPRNGTLIDSDTTRTLSRSVSRTR